MALAALAVPVSAQRDLNLTTNNYYLSFAICVRITFDSKAQEKMQQPTPAPTERGSPPLQAARSSRSHDNVVAAEDHPITYPEPPKNVGSAPFYVLSSLFDRLQNERKPEKRRKLLDSWFNHWRQEKGYDLYPVLRLILPQKDRERAVYGLKEKNLAKIYIKLIPLQRTDFDAVRMLNWKKPTERDATSGDFPTVLYEVISKRSSVMEGMLSVDDINDVLDQLAENMGKSDRQAKIMQRVYNRTTPEEQRWIVRIILKDMQISVKETTVFSVFHPDAHDLFNTCSDLKKVAWELWDPMRRLKEEDKAVQLFRAFAPMLCRRPTRKIEESIKEMGGTKFFIEEKLDGERIQLHKRGNEYFYCSRKGKDYTYLYGKHVGTGSLTPYIEDAFDSRIDDLRTQPTIGTLKTAALDKSKKEFNPRPCFKIFDLLYLNGMSLLHKSLKFRKRNLRAYIKEVKGRIEYATEWEGRTAQDVRKRMDDIMEARGEGLVLKHPDSEYVLNGRNRDWIKVKPEYMDNLGETVDVLVVAGNYGTGRRSGGVSTIICALLNDKHRSDDGEPKYSSFVRIGTGLSFADYMWIRQKPWKEWDPKNPPSFLLVSKKGQEDKGDVYLEPEDSFLLKIKAAEITPSDQYHLGVTMRFPRAIAIRDDLSPEDCMTASAVLDNLHNQKKRKMSTEEDDGKAKKKRKPAKKVEVLPQYKGVNLKDVKVESDLFEGMKFMVASDPKSRTGDADKAELMKLEGSIKANGGSFTQVASNKYPDLLVVYGGQNTPYDIKLIMDKDVHSIIRPEWIKDCIAKDALVPLTKKYFFHATTARMENEEYQREDEGEEEEPEEVASPQPEEASEEATEPEATPSAEEKEEEIDPALADWFKVEKEETPERPDLRQNEADSETEPDSENEDVKDEDADVNEPDDDWLNIPSGSAVEDTDVKMGESEKDMEYDQELIFKHLCFYLDSPANAREVGMEVKTKHEAEITKNFDEISRLITENGGRIVGLDEPKLTHIIVDKRDISRRVALIRRTSKPKRRHLVLSEFIHACLDEDTLLDEDEFSP
ncbi:hypothetical protein NM688_g581 [Phlebia brevispora]|uniref:Uncharacterized protein n=1 Tax=Phlebia brevispora TaxID=194682 RepID=A0ACC1TDX9_9APHY|nr:hypothetical protein NM688_g581 [Phlebia brevispora]